MLARTVARTVGGITFLLSTIVLTHPLQAQEYLSPEEVVVALMDGQPWDAVTSGGRKAKITLNQDGTGKFQGPITMSINWQVEGDEVCLNLKMAGTKCLQFVAEGSSFQAFKDGDLDMTLTRETPSAF